MIGGCGKNELPSLTKPTKAPEPEKRLTPSSRASCCESLVERAYARTLTTLRQVEHELKSEHLALEQLSPQATALAQSLLADLAQVLHDADERVQGQRTLMRTRVQREKLHEFEHGEAPTL